MDNRMDTRLLGGWIVDPDDTQALAEFGRVELEFTADCRLVYTIDEGNRRQKIFLTYQAENGVIMTNQPSSPREERTAYTITAEGRLVLDYGGRRCTYVRAV